MTKQKLEEFYKALKFLGVSKELLLTRLNEYGDRTEHYILTKFRNDIPFSRLLSLLFYWDGTKEGDNFWNNIAHKIDFVKFKMKINRKIKIHG